jgi:hypothetical protein
MPFPPWRRVTRIGLGDFRFRLPAYPVVSFLVEGIDDLVRGLAERSVEFVVPDAESFAGVKGERKGHVVDFGAVRSTWLRDSEGNLLALNELATAS